jgi:3-hydroxybutyrate dehydrogenase
MLNGAVSLVTGGGRGIGRAIALALAEAGSRVAVGARTRDQIDQVAREIEEAGGESLAVLCDVTDAASVALAVESARDRFGRIDILVNNAGVAESAPLDKMHDELWDRMIAVNLTGTYRCTRAVLPEMVARGSGRVINVASVAARVGKPYISAYCASKHGVLGFTRAVAAEVAASGVTVNAVCPGYVDTDLTDAAVARIVETTRRTPLEARRALEAMNPQHRLIQPEEVAAAVVYLASDAARGINAQAITIDGGAVMP